MDARRIRHIPVIKDNKLNAIVSSRDVMAAQLEETKSHCTTLGLAYEMAR
jgi:signal-transduction protein with cAMP-binding, CBS, and nucleotidyltransferase domain